MATLSSLSSIIVNQFDCWMQNWRRNKLLISTNNQTIHQSIHPFTNPPKNKSPNQLLTNCLNQMHASMHVHTPTHMTYTHTQHTHWNTYHLTNRHTCIINKHTYLQQIHSFILVLVSRGGLELAGIEPLAITATTRGTCDTGKCLVGLGAKHPLYELFRFASPNEKQETKNQVFYMSQ